jgi:hypothetical protein
VDGLLEVYQYYRMTLCLSRAAPYCVNFESTFVSGAFTSAIDC